MPLAIGATSAMTTRPPTRKQPAQAMAASISSYANAEHGTIWVITNDIRGEGEGPITTVLFPDDY